MIGYVLIGLLVWMLLSALAAPLIGRLLKQNRDEEDLWPFN